MKELTVISGKGGTGKTSVLAAFATLTSGRIVLADCDVDAADLHLVMDPTIQRESEFRGGYEAVIEPEKCTGCGQCEEYCRFEAVREGVGGKRVIDPLLCEGCRVCAWFCPEKAVRCVEALSGHWYVSETRHGPMVHARLAVGGENSGKLVAEVRDAARKMAEERGLPTVLIDGPPGIGCSAIASMTGADQILVVTEPTSSGLHDLKRVASLGDHFRIPVAVCVNRWDINPAQTEVIEQWAEDQPCSVVGRVRYDRNVVRSQLERSSVVEYGPGGANDDICCVWTEIESLMNSD